MRFLGILLLIALISVHFLQAGDVKTIKITLPKIMDPDNPGQIIDSQYIGNTMGVGDFDGDGDFDYLVRYFFDRKKYPSATTKTFAMENIGDKNSDKHLWTFDHRVSYKDFHPIERCAMALILAWNIDGSADGSEEVITTDDKYLYVLDGMTGKTKRKVELVTKPKRWINGCIAYLNGSNNEPYIVVGYGKNFRLEVYDRNLVRICTFSQPEYNHFFETKRIYAYDVDGDGKDEIIMGGFIFKVDIPGKNIELDFDGTTFYKGYEQKGSFSRSFIADIDWDNPGLEFFFIRKDEPYGSVQTWQPRNWHGPYLVSLKTRKLLWHYCGNEKNETGWGNMHRGWLADIDPDVPGLEMFCTGYFWKGDEWSKALDSKNSTGDWPQLTERSFILSAKGKVLDEIYGYNVGYPLFWDDDAGAEYFAYRHGVLFSEYYNNNNYGHKERSIIQGGLPKANHKGECSIADVTGDWREEIIMASGHDLYIFTNSDKSQYKCSSPRTDRVYRLGFASMASGLPKPYIPGPNWDGWCNWYSQNSNFSCKQLGGSQWRN